MMFRWMLVAWLGPLSCLAQKGAPSTPRPVDEPGSRADEPMVDVQKAAPQLVVELRYTTDRNLTKAPIYPKNARCYLRKSVVDRLVKAQAWLEKSAPRGTRLKIWDGWRPAWAHEKLWRAYPNREFLGNPRTGGSLHTWGVAVDATLVDAAGRDLRMPTDFDVFTPAAKTFYEGPDPEIGRNVRMLQQAMTVAGFKVVHDEWWHFVARDHAAFGPVDLSITGDEAPE